MTNPYAPQGMPPTPGVPIPQAMPPIPQLIEPTLGEASVAKIRELSGRALLIQGTSYDPMAPGLKKGEVAPAVTMTVLVLDGGPLAYGSNATAGTGATHQVQVPCILEGVMSSHPSIVRSVRPTVDTPNIVIGRIKRGVTQKVGNSPPWHLEPLAGDDPLRSTAVQLWVAIKSGQQSNPEPIEIGTGPAVQPAVQQAGPGAAYAAYGQQPAMAAPAPPVPQQFGAAPAVPPALSALGWTAEMLGGLKPEELAAVMAQAGIVTGY